MWTGPDRRDSVTVTMLHQIERGSACSVGLVDNSSFTRSSIATLHEQILSIPYCFLGRRFFINTVWMGTFGLHELISCVAEGYFSELICVYNVGIKTFDLHGLILLDAFQNPL